MNFAKCKNRCNLFSFLAVCACLLSFVKCDGVLCGEAPQIPNAQPDFQGLNQPFRNGTNITYNCIDGFVLHPGANPHVACVVENETATWIYEGNALCTQACGDLPVIPHAKPEMQGKQPPFQSGVKILFKCDRGHISGGNLIYIECAVSDGSAAWIPPTHSCTPRNCGFPGDIEHAQRRGNVYTFSKNVTYICNEGYKMRGRAMILCSASGNWEPSLPSCEAVICPILSNPENGRVVSVDRHFGAIASYQCNKGYRLEGPSQRTCGMNDQWSENSPVCTVVTCLPPGDPENARVVNTKETYNVNDFVIFKCLLSQETLTSKCLETGHWSARPPSCPGPTVSTTSETPQTTAITVPPTKVITNSPGHVNESKCEDPGDIPHGKRMASGFTPGSNVTYTCEDGYDLRGKGTLVCLGTGKWDLDKLPICVKPAFVVLLVVFSLWTTEFVFRSSSF